MKEAIVKSKDVNQRCLVVRAEDLIQGAEAASGQCSPGGHNPHSLSADHWQLFCRTDDLPASRPAVVLHSKLSSLQSQILIVHTGNNIWGAKAALGECPPGCDCPHSLPSHHWQLSCRASRHCFRLVFHAPLAVWHKRFDYHRLSLVVTQVSEVPDWPSGLLQFAAGDSIMLCSSSLLALQCASQIRLDSVVSHAECHAAHRLMQHPLLLGPI